MSLVALPPEVLCIIGRLLYSPFVYTIEKEGMESVAPPFVPNTGERRVDLNSFLAFSSTCRTVRTATRPLVFTSIRLRNLEDLSEVLDSDWKPHVRVLDLRLDLFVEDDDDATHMAMRYAAAFQLEPIFTSLPNVQHLHIRVANHTGLDVLALVFARISALPTSPPFFFDQVKSLSLAMDSTGDINDLWVFRPLLERAASLEFLSLKVAFNNGCAGLRSLLHCLKRQLHTLVVGGLHDTLKDFVLDGLRGQTRLEVLVWESMCIHPNQLETEGRDMYAEDLYTALGRYSLRFLRLKTSTDFVASMKHVATLAEHCQHLQVVTFRRTTDVVSVKHRDTTWGVLRPSSSSSSESRPEPVVFRLEPGDWERLKSGDPTLYEALVPKPKPNSQASSVATVEEW